MHDVPLALEDHWIDLPLPLSVNDAYATLPNGRRITSRQKRLWTQETHRLLNERGLVPVRTVLRHPRKGRKTDRNQFTLELTVRLFTWTSDIDNRVKPLLDLLCDRLMLNDAYCIDVHIRRYTALTKGDEGIAGFLTVYHEPGKAGNPPACQRTP
jgi:hypothetical protein